MAANAPPAYDPNAEKYGAGPGAGQGYNYNTQYGVQSQVPTYPTQPAPAYPAHGPPPVAPYPNYQTGPATNVYVGATPTVITPSNVHTLGRYPCHMTCPKCSAQIQTTVDYQVSGATWLMCLIIFGIGCLGTLLFAIGFVLWFVCCIPCCINDCKEAVHTCPSCRAHIGTVKPVHL